MSTAGRCLVAPVVLLAVGCADTRASRDRGATGFFENVPVYPAPVASRCDRFKKGGGASTACEEAKYLAQIYVRRLSTGDEVCLEGGFGERAGAGCLARAAVVDTAPERNLLEVREARPDSKWFKKEQHQFWFEEGALVDLYLSEHGY